jgi:hypothetical protein
MIENHVNLTIIETGTHILTHIIEYDKNGTKNKTIRQLLSKIGRKDNIVVMDFKVLVSISQWTL